MSIMLVAAINCWATNAKNKHSNVNKQATINEIECDSRFIASDMNSRQCCDTGILNVDNVDYSIKLNSRRTRDADSHNR